MTEKKAQTVAQRLTELERRFNDFMEYEDKVVDIVLSRMELEAALREGHEAMRMLLRERRTGDDAVFTRAQRLGRTAIDRAQAEAFRRAGVSS